MATSLYTDDDLTALQEMRKSVINPRAQWIEKPKIMPSHRQRTFHLQGQGDVRFAIYQRQNLLVESDFSCGIHHCPSSTTRVTLARYNGASHVHGEIHYRAHIHRATAEAIAAGRRPESHATPTDRYTTLEGATACLLEDFHVAGIAAKHDEPRLIP